MCTEHKYVSSEIEDMDCIENGTPLSTFDRRSSRPQMETRQPSEETRATNSESELDIELSFLDDEEIETPMMTDDMDDVLSEIGPFSLAGFLPRRCSSPENNCPSTQDATSSSLTDDGDSFPSSPFSLSTSMEDCILKADISPQAGKCSPDSDLTSPRRRLIKCTKPLSPRVLALNAAWGIECENEKDIFPTFILSMDADLEEDRPSSLSPRKRVHFDQDVSIIYMENAEMAEAYSEARTNWEFRDQVRREHAFKARCAELEAKLSDILRNHIQRHNLMVPNQPVVVHPVPFIHC